MFDDVRSACSWLENDGLFQRTNQLQPFSTCTGLHVRSMCGQPTCPTAFGFKTRDSASASAFDMLSKRNGVPHGTATDKPWASQAPVRSKGCGLKLLTRVEADMSRPAEVLPCQTARHPLNGKSRSPRITAPCEAQRKLWVWVGCRVSRENTTDVTAALEPSTPKRNGLLRCPVPQQPLVGLPTRGAILRLLTVSSLAQPAWKNSCCPCSFKPCRWPSPRENRTVLLQGHLSQCGPKKRGQTFYSAT